MNDTDTKAFPTITLYSYVTSPYAMKVHCYLLYKQLPFKIIYVNPLRAADELPVSKQIPVLQIEKEARVESSALGVWLDNLFPAVPLLPIDTLPKRRVLEIDQWVSEQLIPTVFYSIYPQMNHLLPLQIKNTIHLGHCIEQTTNSGIPRGIRLLWPLFIRRAHFIRQMVAPLKRNITVSEQRKNVLFFLDKTLQDCSYLAGTEYPTLADLSAWPQIYVPYQLGLKGMDDFTDYSNIMRWVENLKCSMNASKHLPPLVPSSLRVHQ